MTRPILASIDLAAMRRNLAIARHHAGGAKVLAVVKANAYGHGLENVLPALEDADGFAVLELDAALRLRQFGITQPILMLEGFFGSEELQVISGSGLSTVMHESTQVEMLLSTSLPRAVDVFLKFNTGMNRLGFSIDKADEMFRALKRSDNVGNIVVMTHFADADGKQGVDWQLRPLTEIAERLNLAVCAANSAALLRYPQSCGEWVRPGIMLYGSSPFADQTAHDLGLQAVMTLSSSIIAIQDLKIGDRVGYGGTFVADRAMRIGIVACGYADGYPRHAPSGTPVLVAGKPSVTVGTVAMDMMCVDITGRADASVGSNVVLWGKGMPIDEVAASAGTLGYELLTKVTSRVPFFVST